MRMFLLALQCFLFLGIIAQNPEWIYFSKISGINCFAEEGDYIWIGTKAGAVKMNKTSGEMIYYDKTTCSIPDNYVNDIVVGNDGVKWFGTQNSGIVKFDGINWTLFDSSNTALNYNSIRDLAIDNSNTLWATTNYYNSGITKYDGYQWFNYNIENSVLPDNYINCMFSDGDNIWFGLPGNLIKFDKSKWIVFNRENSDISNEIIIEIDKDKNGNIWLLHYGGIEKLSNGKFTYYNKIITNPPIGNNHSIDIDENNIVWIGYSSHTKNIGGVLSFNGETWTKYDSSNSDISGVNGGIIFFDKSNNLWIGNSRNGLIDQKQGENWYHYNPSKAQLESGLIMDILFDNDENAYIYNGIELVKFNWNNWTQLRKYYGSHYFFTTDKYGNIFEKDSRTLYKYDGAKWNYIHTNSLLDSLNPSYDQTIVVDSTDYIWMDCITSITYEFDSFLYYYYPVFHKGLAYNDGQEWIIVEDTGHLNYLSSISELKVDYENNIWLKTFYGGLLKYDRNQWEEILKNHSPLSRKNFEFDTLNNIWTSDEHYGLLKFDGIYWEQFLHPEMNSYSGFPEIEIDKDGSIWQRMQFKLICFDGENWTTYDGSNSPLPTYGNITSLSIDKHGNKWIGTRSGFYVFKKDGVKVSQNIQTVYNDISVKVYPNPMYENINIILPKYFDNIEFSLYDLTAKKLFFKKHYHTDHFTVSLRNLDSGLYLYRIKSNNKILASGKLSVQ